MYIYYENSQSPSAKTPIFILIIILITACGCATTINGDQTLSIPVHGNFCGPKHPVVDTGSKVGNVVELLKIPIFDDYDDSCRMHDICYEVFGYFSKQCDSILASEINDINVININKNQVQYCAQFKEVIVFSYQTRYMRMIKDVDNIILDFPFQAIGGAGAVANLLLLNLDHSIKKATGKLKLYQCRRRNSPDIATYFYYDSLIEILAYYKLINQVTASDLRAKLRINNRDTYAVRWSHSIQEVMKINFDHPVLSGKWASAEKAAQIAAQNPQRASSPISNEANPLGLQVNSVIER